MTESRQSSSARRLLALLAETSVHAGMGAQLGAVDLPIQRERHTEWPTIYGSGLKGVLRAHAEGRGWTQNEINAVFGPPSEKGEGAREADRYAGALAVSDAKLLLFPVRTVGYAFTWITCPLALARLARDASQAGLADMPALTGSPTEDTVLVPNTWPAKEKGVMLEEFVYEKPRAADEVAKLGAWIAANLMPPARAYAFWREHVKKALVVVSDDDFRDFVRHGTEIATRVKLTREKTVEEHMLWTEEALPSDTLLCSFVGAWKPAKNGASALPGPEAVLERVDDLLKKQPVLQVGGKETVGRGFVAARLVGGNHAKA